MANALLNLADRDFARGIQWYTYAASPPLHPLFTMRAPSQHLVISKLALLSLSEHSPGTDSPPSVTLLDETC
ncbi:hypothetical protein [Cerasicoccus arenae]|uniref:hypothetical protein n=1 Tax=Cerasicoccus arenae TaxID=424488 RepID=UPI00167C29DB|nr:hypothetical protein [Cerasicoccus arenae]